MQQIDKSRFNILLVWCPLASLPSVRLAVLADCVVVCDIPDGLRGGGAYGREERGITGFVGAVSGSFVGCSSGVVGEFFAPADCPRSKTKLYE